MSVAEPSGADPVAKATVPVGAFLPVTAETVAVS
jgi:hypothetical protein